MPIDVVCSACGKRLKAPDEQAGRKGRCPACKAELAIPASAAGTVTAAARNSSVAIATPPPRSASATISQAASNSPAASKSISDSRSGAEARDIPSVKNEVPPAAESESALEPKHWFALSTALQVTKNALLLSWISLGLLGLAMVGRILASKSTEGDVVISQAIALLELWGRSGIVLGWTILFGGWLTCLAAWPATERRWLRFSVGITVVLFVLLLILPALQIFGIGEGSNSLKTALSETVPRIVFGMAAAASLITFSNFLSVLETRMGNEHQPHESLVRAIIIGVLMFWCIAANLFFEQNAQWKAWLFVASNLAAFFTPFIWLWLLNVHVSGHLRVSQAWKRLS